MKLIEFLSKFLDNKIILQQYRSDKRFMAVYAGNIYDLVESVDRWRGVLETTIFVSYIQNGVLIVNYGI